MDNDSTVYPNSACNLPAATLSPTSGSLHLSLLSLLDETAILNISPSTLLTLDELWPLDALPGLSPEFGFQNCVPNALNLAIPTTQNDICAQVFPQYSPQPLPSPATSTDSCASFSIEQSFEDMFPVISPVGQSGIALPSPVTMGHDISFPFFVGASPPANVITQAVQNIPAHAIDGVLSPGSVAPSLACHPVVSPVSASLVRASSKPAQGGLMGQESFLSCGPSSVGQSWQTPPPSIPISLSDLHPNASSYLLPTSASLSVLPLQDPHPLSKLSGATAFSQSVSVPASLNMNVIAHYQGLSSTGTVEDGCISPSATVEVSSTKDTTTVSEGVMHPSLALSVPAVNVTIDSSSPQLSVPPMSTPTSPQTAEPVRATSAKSSPSGTASPLGATTSALDTPSTSDIVEDVSTHSVPPSVRIRKTGLKRTHECDQCSQSYVRAEHLRRHVKAKHMGLKEHACGLCDFRCSRSDNLRQHRRTMHDG